MSKNQLRKKILKIREKNYYRNKLNVDRILNIVKNCKKNKKVIGCYFAVNFEVNTDRLIEVLDKKKFIICLPVIKKNKEMEFYRYKKNDPLYVNKYGIPEPKQKKKMIPDILLIPIVAFDKELNRLGYGGGFYDRYLKKTTKQKIFKIGLALSCQNVKKIPIEKFDKKMDAIITEKKIYI